jgi:hypothetical protein
LVVNGKGDTINPDLQRFLSGVEELVKSLATEGFLPAPLEYTYEYLAKLEAAVAAQYREGAAVSVEALLPAGYVLGEVLCRNLDGQWGSVLGQDFYNMTVHARGYTLYPFVRTVNFVRDRKRTLTSIYELIDGADADELKESPTTARGQNNTPHTGSGRGLAGVQASLPGGQSPRGAE